MYDVLVEYAVRQCWLEEKVRVSDDNATSKTGCPCWLAV